MCARRRGQGALTGETLGCIQSQADAVHQLTYQIWQRVHEIGALVEWVWAQVEKGYYLNLTIQPHQKIRFLEFFFRILNMFKIVSKKKINFSQNWSFFVAPVQSKNFQVQKLFKNIFFLCWIKDNFFKYVFEKLKTCKSTWEKKQEIKGIIFNNFYVKI